MGRSYRLAAVALGAALVAGCTSEATSDDTEAGGLPEAVVEAARSPVDGGIADAVDLSDVELWVGSPTTGEDDATPALLAAISARALRQAGANVREETDLGGGFLLRDALVSGEVDLTWEGTGTAWTAILRQPPGGLDATEIHERLAVRDLEENGVVWLEPAGFDYGPEFAVAEATADEEGLATLTDMAERLAADDESLVCVTTSFMTIPTDGRVAVQEALDMEFDDERLRVFDPEPIYPDTGDGSCLFGVVGSTSGRIPAYDLVVLEDDVAAFQPNVPAPAVREDLLVDHPEVATVLNAVAERLDADEIRAMNRRVVLEEGDIDAVAEEWLRNEGLIE